MASPTAAELPIKGQIFQVNYYPVPVTAFNKLYLIPEIWIFGMYLPIELWLITSMSFYNLQYKLYLGLFLFYYLCFGLHSYYSMHKCMR